MNYLIFRGYSTHESLTGIAVKEMPSHKRAGLRYTEFRVNGRDGVMHISEGYDAFEIKAKLILLNGAATQRQVINAWADGTGKLITSDDTTKAYMASVLREVKFTRDEVSSGVYQDVAEITFTCQPYMVEAVESEFTYTGSGTILNTGDAPCYPLIKVTGSGTCYVSIGGSLITLTGVNSSKPVTIDSENGYVYAEDGAKTMTGEFPVLPVGQTSVSISGGTAKVEIKPRLRWL